MHEQVSLSFNGHTVMNVGLECVSEGSDNNNIGAITYMNNVKHIDDLMFS